jgi:hypothetical protein
MVPLIWRKSAETLPSQTVSKSSIAKWMLRAASNRMSESVALSVSPSTVATTPPT